MPVAAIAMSHENIEALTSLKEPCSRLEYVKDRQHDTMIHGENSSRSAEKMSKLRRIGIPRE